LSRCVVGLRCCSRLLAASSAHMHRAVGVRTALC
jgi:hypothetical protein